jgi:hypothetical protein
MRIVAACTISLMLAGCGGSVSTPPPSVSTYDPEEAKRLIEAQTSCFTREAQSKSLDKWDLETAALAVQARCVAETQRFKAFAARHTPESVPAFEARMRGTEADDLQFIRQALALVRTSK